MLGCPCQYIASLQGRMPDHTRCHLSCRRVKVEGFTTQNLAVEGNGMQDMFDVPLGSL